ncbi:CubicO group peptidase (beta-lactamase class C family) [Streptomyces sp. Ag109_O5-1]|uniref:serine hydrolase domain-containing protein n=1 Tax=Streptomyces sp. Ag109_O5-1 TaxID=1938851 RepID=UPI000F4D33F2|nr:serine hydrolase domain-containing protein [Streptomyces sp. Ag109_O5-1]RPE45854.1 CubicO group peptidase (beta-lactamase class C family) [Streptomyces sp. Ag109_O5-1]
MPQDKLSEFVKAQATELGVPGAAVGVLVDGQEIYASHGVTSLANPSPVDRKTLFHLASVSKTFTATALMRLVAEGKVDLDAPVRRYVPELELADEQAAAQITVLNLLNHTAGLDWNLIDDGEGDRSLAGLVAKLPQLPLIAPPGARASYSQAGYNLAGRIVEKVTGLPFEQAMVSLVLEPVGLTDTVYGLAEVMVRKFAVGHNRGDDGELRPARPWGAFREGARGDNPGGGLASSVSDLLRWARFQLGDGDGVLPAAELHRMRERTIELRASTLGDGFGICWFLHDLDGLQGFGHGGSGNGQFAELLIVPERNFAVVSLANVGPDGYPFNQSVVRWALEHYLGIVEKTVEPLPYDEGQARQVAGRYEIDAMNLDIASDGIRLALAVGIKPEIREAADEEMPPDYPAAGIGFLPGDGDEYIVTEGGLKGQRGYFSRDADGAVTGVDLAGRLFKRVAQAS